jgi:hypothetical protein
LSTTSSQVLFNFTLTLPYETFHGSHFVIGLAGIPAEMPDRMNGSPLLPLTQEKDTRLKEERDSKLKDEFHKLLNGNHEDPTDRVTELLLDSLC